jgi:hypothetical protein
MASARLPGRRSSTSRPVSLAIRDLRDKPTRRENPERRAASARTAAAGCAPDSCRSRSPDPAGSADPPQSPPACRPHTRRQKCAHLIDHISRTDRRLLHGHRFCPACASGTRATQSRPQRPAPPRTCRARTSLSRPAPAAAASRITIGVLLSTESTASRSPAQGLDHRHNAIELLLLRYRPAPGRVDSPPMSSISAPASAPCARPRDAGRRGRGGRRGTSDRHRRTNPG